MRPIQVLAMLILALFSSAAMALGLGEIQVKSKPGQPLLAEIPIISNEPGELENARARLASAATFARVGLQRPSGVISDLQFEIVANAQGRAVIRVTSVAPIDVQALSFLIEVDWGQGRLVREYSALVNAPQTAAAIAQPEIEAPSVAPSNAIVREPEAAPSVSPAVPAEVAPVPAAPVAVAKPAAPPAAPSPAPRISAQGELEPVRRGQNLSQIARQLGSGHSLDQTMLALLRANPDAFINGNIHRLREGAVLRVPREDELAQLDRAAATAMVREQTAQWRQTRRPTLQPADTGQASVASAPSVQPPASQSQARLEIAPAAAATAQQAGTRSGISAGSEGDRLVNEQLQQAKEDLASRDAEIQELRARVDELDKLQQQQKQLIALKDSDLAAAQQHLAKANADGAGASVLMWGLGGLVLVLAGGAMWWLSRRRKPSPLPPIAGYDNPALAAAPPSADGDDEDILPSFVQESSRDSGGERREPVVEQRAEPEPVADSSIFWSVPVPGGGGGVLPKPVWHRDEAVSTLPVAEPALEPEQIPVGRERLELAIAYLDLGEYGTAQSLLNEVVAGGDDSMRAEALRLLEKIG